jgi:hypothetical protein
MADEGQKVRMVKCVKLGKELPGLDRIPWKGDIGKRVYENVSKDAWKMWVDHSKMLLNASGRFRTSQALTATFASVSCRTVRHGLTPLSRQLWER